MKDKDLCPLGQALDRTRQLAKGWRYLMFGILGVLVAANFLLRNHHPHFCLDAYPGFWPVFGLGVGVLMVFFVKKIVQPLIKRPEDFYNDL